MNHWHVLGVGAIGGLFACRLQESGANVTLLSRRDVAPARELIVSGGSEKRHHFLQQPLEAGTPGAVTEPIANLLITTKAWAVESALQAISQWPGQSPSSHLSPDSWHPGSN